MSGLTIVDVAKTLNTYQRVRLLEEMEESKADGALTKKFKELPQKWLCIGKLEQIRKSQYEPILRAHVRESTRDQLNRYEKELSKVKDLFGVVKFSLTYLIDTKKCERRWRKIKMSKSEYMSDGVKINAVMLRQLLICKGWNQKRNEKNIRLFERLYPEKKVEQLKWVLDKLGMGSGFDSERVVSLLRAVETKEDLKKVEDQLFKEKGKSPESAKDRKALKQLILKKVQDHQLECKKFIRKRVRLTKEQIEELKQLKNSQEMRDFCERHNVNQSTVSTALHRFGVKGELNEYVKNGAPWTSEQIKKLQEYGEKNDFEGVYQDPIFDNHSSNSIERKMTQLRNDPAHGKKYFYELKYKPWTPKEIHLLRTFHSVVDATAAVAQFPGRTVDGVANMWRKVYLHKRDEDKNNVQWTQDEENALLQCRTRHEAAEVSLHGRTKEALMSRWKKLRDEGRLFVEAESEYTPWQQKELDLLAEYKEDLSIRKDWRDTTSRLHEVMDVQHRDLRAILFKWNSSHNPAEEGA